MPLLIPVTTAEVGGVSLFVTKEKFREGITVDGVKIAWTGENFDENFLNKTEKDVAATRLCIHQLKKVSSDAQIITELADTHETTLSHNWELLKKQGSGEKGAFLANGYGNIAYIRGKNDILWAVRFCWHTVIGGWGVEAHSQNSWEWYTGYQIISR